jgi:predicted NBD/HSP70 family sugar kinase
MNSSAALALLLDRGTLTRGDLRTLTGLSKPTTSEVLRRLADAGLAVVIGHTSGGPGPNAEIYAPNPGAGYAAAIAVRDTLTAAVCDITGAVRATVQLAAADPEAAVAAVVTRLCRDAGIPAVGHVQLGIPGSYNAGTDTIAHIDLPGWDQPGLASAIAHRLGTRVGVDNDVNLAAIAERGRGVAGGTEGFAVLWLGNAGLGLALDLGGTILRGARGGAGLWGSRPGGRGAGAACTVERMDPSY